MTPTTDRPLPVLNAETKVLFDSARQGQLILQHCSKCAGYRFIPRKFCDQCGSSDWEWKPASGRGELISFAKVHKVFHPGFANRIPYPIGVVELEEGPRLTSALRVEPETKLQAGMAVQVEFEQRNEEINMPLFRVGQASQ